MRLLTVDEEFELFERVMSGGLPRSFPLEYYHDFHHDLHILRTDWVRGYVVLGTKRWLSLKPIFKTWDWLLNRFYRTLGEFIRYLELRGWMAPIPGYRITPTTVWQWFKTSPNVMVVMKWLRWKN